MYINIKYIMHLYIYIYIVEILPGKFIISCMHKKIFHYMKNFLDENFPSIPAEYTAIRYFKVKYSSV